MSTNSSIEWTETTWNPLLGCSRVSPGCDHCYAINTATLRAGNPHPKVSGAFAGLTERRDGRLDWTGAVNLLPERLVQPLKWRKPRRIFVNSLSDLFHESVPDEYIARVFAVMAATPQHTYQILTKRHGRMRNLLRDECRCGGGHAPGVHFRSSMVWAATPHSDSYVPGLPQISKLLFGGSGWPLPNVWLGVSVEDQKWADIRVPVLLDTPAAVRWLSCEPLLGPLDLAGWAYDQASQSIDWVVAGGESGPGARPMLPDWARSLRDQCVQGGVPFLFKQWGNWAPNGSRGIGNINPRERLVGQPVGDMGHLEVIERLGKKAAGRLLDGRTWDEYPNREADRG